MARSWVRGLVRLGKSHGKRLGKKHGRMFGKRHGKRYGKKFGKTDAAIEGPQSANLKAR